MSHFEYRSLTPHQSRIRLINLLPKTHHLPGQSSLHCEHKDLHSSHAGNPVFCTLSHFSLDAAPVYSALSYNWGDSARRVGIRLNGATIMVTENLEAALRHLRLQDKPLTLWIDALCIDQNDEVEKGEQLKHMGQIYAQALSVVAWLGPAADNSDLALDWIRERGGRSLHFGLGTRPELRLRYLLEAFEPTGNDLVSPRLKEFAEDLQEDFSPTSLGHEEIITALSRVFKRPYWSRIWVVQELSSASRLTFMCGSMTVTDDQLNHALRILRNFGQYQHLQRNQEFAHSPRVLVNSIETCNPINLIKFQRAAVQSPLIHLMRSFRHFQATDPRDMVFALLGISQDTKALGLYADYRKTCQEVYSNLARTLIRNGYVELLSLCEFPKQIDSLPSWVHDWSARGHRSPLQQRSLDRRARPFTTILEPKFSASGTYQTTSPEGGHMIDWKMPLLLYATFLGKVQQIGMSWDRNDVGGWLLDLQKLYSLIPDTCNLSGGGAHAVWRTAVADQEIRQGVRKPRLSGEKIRAVHELLDGVNMGLGVEQKLLAAGLNDYCEQLQAVAQGRRPLLASGGYLGIGPCETEQGDLVFILHGADTPYILRRHSHDKTFQLIGEAYIHGVMDGEAMEGCPDVEEISLI